MEKSTVIDKLTLALGTIVEAEIHQPNELKLTIDVVDSRKTIFIDSGFKPEEIIGSRVKVILMQTNGIEKICLAFI